MVMQLSGDKSEAEMATVDMLANVVSWIIATDKLVFVLFNYALTFWIVY